MRVRRSHLFCLEIKQPEVNHGSNLTGREINIVAPFKQEKIRTRVKHEVSTDLPLSTAMRGEENPWLFTQPATPRGIHVDLTHKDGNLPQRHCLQSKTTTSREKI
jgi:hypothetical protein